MRSPAGTVAGYWRTCTRSSPFPFFCTQFWFALKGLVWKHWNCCPVLCCHACGTQSLLCPECWINIQPWQLGIDGEAKPSWCQWGMMRLGLLWPWAAFCHFPPRKCLACEFFFFLYCHLYEHQAVCYGHSAFLATSEEVLSAQLEFLACVWARLTWKITHVLQTSF